MNVPSLQLVIAVFRRCVSHPDLLLWSWALEQIHHPHHVACITAHLQLNAISNSHTHLCGNMGYCCIHVDVNIYLCRLHLRFSLSLIKYCNNGLYLIMLKYLLLIFILLFLVINMCFLIYGSKNCSAYYLQILVLVYWIIGTFTSSPPPNPRLAPSIDIFHFPYDSNGAFQANPRM
jgi:hypothetical protein